MQTRNAARVLPEPVGAAISVSRPAAISPQPPACGRVGPSGNRRWNQIRTAGWKRSITRALYRPPETASSGRRPLRVEAHDRRPASHSLDPDVLGALDVWGDVGCGDDHLRGERLVGAITGPIEIGEE